MSLAESNYADAGAPSKIKQAALAVVVSAPAVNASITPQRTDSARMACGVRLIGQRVTLIITHGAAHRQIRFCGS
jgi:hypothetical protein